jgi:aminopeptidase YwaD
MARLAGALLVLSLALWPQGRARAEEEASDPLKGLSGTAALEIAKDLSADKMKGRRTGFDGGRVADDYVAQAMAEMGLDPKDPGGAYLDAFEFEAAQVKGPIAFALDGKPFVYGKDYVELGHAGAGKADAEVVFVGFGISAPAKGHDDYGSDASLVKGKVVLALRGRPEERAADLVAEGTIGAKIAAARGRGARAFLLAGDETARVHQAEFGWGGPGIPALCLSSAATARLLTAGGITLETPRNGKPLATKAKVTLEMNVERLPQAKGHNALGAIAGRDPDLRGEVVLVGANVDHLGVDAEGRPYAGADDNASGTAVVLHLAKTLIDNGWRPKRTILFVTFGAGESGRAGSRHLAESGLPFDNDGVVGVLIVERVGQGAPEVAVTGGERFPEASPRLVGYVPEAFRKSVTVAPSPDAGGDHVAFADRGVPAFLLTTRGEHANVRTREDVAANLKPECLEAAARVLGAIVVGVGDDPTSGKK